MKLDDGLLIYAPTDTDSVIKKFEKEDVPFDDD